MVFVHDSPHQKQNFLNLIVCHIHHPSQLWNKKIDHDYHHLNFKNTIIQNCFDYLQFVKKTSSPCSLCKFFSFCTLKSICMTKWVVATSPIVFFIFENQILNFWACVVIQVCDLCCQNF